MKKFLGLFLTLVCSFYSFPASAQETANQPVPTLYETENVKVATPEEIKLMLEEKQKHWQEQAQKMIEKEVQSHEKAEAKGIPYKEDYCYDEMKKIALSMQKMWLQLEKLDEINYRLSDIMDKYQINQEKLEEQWLKVTTRGSFTILFLGPNYKALNAANEILIAQKDLYGQMEVLAGEIGNTDNKKAYKATLDDFRILIDDIDKNLQFEARRFGLFGWLMKRFAR
jgi:hypothetical protein